MIDAERIARNRWKPLSHQPEYRPDKWCRPRWLLRLHMIRGQKKIDAMPVDTFAQQMAQISAAMKL